MIIFPLIALSATASYLFFENNVPVVTQLVCESPRLSQTDDGYKIVHLSDIHNTHSHLLKNKIFENVRKIQPDVIVITGDLIDKRRTDIDTAAAIAKELMGIAPVYFVMGNHETAITSFRELERKLTEAGVNILHGRSVQLSDTLTLCGTDDINNIKGSSSKEKITKALSGLIKNEDSFTILLSHRPELFDSYCDFSADLVLTGHAHGGQIRLPVIGGLFSPGEGFFPEYESGMHEKNGTKMIISRGIGNSSFPFRINNRPEIISITLKCR